MFLTKILNEEEGMEKKELIQRSPVRILMDSIQGGLGPGEIGLIASPSGIGKTSVLVQIALDKLLQDKKIIHISFTRHTDYVLAWYESIFDEFTKKKNLSNEQEIKDGIVKNRVLMKFTQEGVSGEQILRSLKALIKDGNFGADAIIIDGYDFTATDESQIKKVKLFAAEMGVSIWYSCTVKGKEPYYDKQNVPLLIKDYDDLFEVIIILDPKTDHISLSVSRNRGNHNPKSPALKLDPKTLLMLKE